MNISFFVLVDLESDDPMPSVTSIERRLEAALEHSTAREALSESMQADVSLRLAEVGDFER